MFDYNTVGSQSQDLIAKIDNIKLHKDYQIKFRDCLRSALRNCDQYTEMKGERVYDCGSFIEIDNNCRISAANFCKNRFCPMCQWRLSRSVFGRIAKVQSYVESVIDDVEFILLTVTILNTIRLSDGINHIITGFNNLTHDRTFRKAQKGFIRSVEITYNPKACTWHPHIHAILAVDRSYFEKYYMSQQEWRSLWERAARLNYVSQVNVKKVYDDRYKAIAEVAKYAVKPFDIARLDEQDKVFLLGELLSCTYRRRLRSYGGVFRKAIQALKIDFDNPLDDDIAVSSAEQEHMYMLFRGGEYKLLTRDDLTACAGEGFLYEQ